MKLSTLTFGCATLAVSIWAAAGCTTTAEDDSDGMGGEGAVDGSGGTGSGGTASGTGATTNGSGGDGSGGGSGSEILCEGGNKLGGEAPMIDDFEDGNLEILDNEFRGGGWQLNAAAGATTSGPTNVDSGDGDRGNVLEFSWSDLDGTWGANVLAPLGGSCVDASVYNGVAFWAKGTGTVMFQVRTTSTTPESLGGACTGDGCDVQDYYGINIQLRDEWSRYAVAWEDLAQRGIGVTDVDFHPEEIEAISILASGSADVMMDDITFMTASDPGEELNGEISTGMGGAGGT